MDYKEKVIALLNSQELSKEQKEKLEHIFPELAESEDERTRKDIIQFVQSRLAGFPECERFVAWLEKQGDNGNQNWKPSKGQINALEHFVRSIGESGYASPYDDNTKLLKSLMNDLYKLEKQGESKPADKVEPKFKVGDWVVFNHNCNGNSIYQIEQIENYQYTLKHILGGSLHVGFDNEELLKLWTIQDAKDGDVLVCNRTIVVVKHKYNNTPSFDSACAYIGEDDSLISSQYCYHACGSSWHPATKEQRDLLFQKMKEAGYEWDAEKKEPKKIEI